MQIGVISDTHGHLDPRVFHYFDSCDQIWHAGDIGNEALLESLQNFRPLKAVYGNVDGKEIRQRVPGDSWFDCQGLEIFITHIAGYPPKYNPKTIKKLSDRIPDILVTGHSHILKIITDTQRNKMLYINPGAAGIQGFHKIKTLVRFEINSSRVKNLQVIELEKRWGD